MEWPVKTYIHQLCMGTGCHLADLPRVMTHKDRLEGIHSVGCIDVDNFSKSSL